jgi:hypothetical protein
MGRGFWQISEAGNASVAVGMIGNEFMPKSTAPELAFQ